MYEAQSYELSPDTKLLDGEFQTTLQTDYRDAINTMMEDIRPLFEKNEMGMPTTMKESISILAGVKDEAPLLGLADDLAQVLEKHEYVRLPHDLYPQLEQSFQYEEDSLSSIPIESLRRTISTDTYMLENWKRRLSKRMEPILAVEVEQQTTLVQLVYQHERAVASIMSANIAAMENSVIVVESVLQEREQT